MNNRFLLLIIIVIGVGCNSPKDRQKKTNDEARNSPLVKTEEKKSENVNIQNKNINTNISLSQLVYSENEKRAENIGKLKHDPSTQKKTYSYKNEIAENEITLYYIDKRIVRVEKRIWKDEDKKVQLGYSMYDFNDKNICIANTERNYKEGMSYTNAMIGDSLIRYDVNCKIILIDKLQKNKIILSVENSLDSVMAHFPEFKYNLEFK